MKKRPLKKLSKIGQLRFYLRQNWRLCRINRVLSEEDMKASVIADILDYIDDSTVTYFTIRMLGLARPTKKKSKKKDLR